MKTEIKAARPIQDFAQNPVIQLRQDLRIMKDYLMMCAGKEDWHGVMDAAVDIREIVAKLSVLA